jgi:hypothetical protein
MPGFHTRHRATAACAAFIEESRMKFINTSKLRRQSGVWGTQPSLAVLGKAMGPLIRSLFSHCYGETYTECRF